MTFKVGDNVKYHDGREDVVYTIESFDNKGDLIFVGYPFNVYGSYSPEYYILVKPILDWSALNKEFSV